MSPMILPPAPFEPIDRKEFDVDAMDAEALNNLPFGAIKVDAEGRILFYNKAESLLSGRAPERVIGRRFFQEVAPCTNIPSFYGRFIGVVVAERAHVSFTFVFDFAMRPVRVCVDMAPARDAGQYWIIVRPIECLLSEEETEAQRLVKAAQSRVVGESFDPTICDREQIHLPDAIQPHGALIVIDRAEFTVCAVSGNLEEMIGVPQAQALGQSADRLFERGFLQTILKATSRLGVREGGATRMKNGRWFSFMAFQSGPFLIAELQYDSAAPDLDGYRRNEARAFLDEFFDAVVRAPPSDFVAQDAARIFCEFSGFDRVLVYQFDEDGNGSVFAEEKATDWEQSLVGLDFPASDIPKQARTLYLRNRVRHIPNNAYIASDLVRAPILGESTPIDLSLASLRSISPIHREYLNNMGVVASFSASILVEGALWGLVIGHHRKPRYLSWDRLDAIERAAELLGPRLAQSESHDTQVARLRHEAAHRAFIEQLAGTEDLLDSFVRGPINLVDLMAHCTGAAAQMGGRLVLVGRTPSMDSVRGLVSWLQKSMKEEVWATDCLSGDMPEMLVEKATASGILVTFLTHTRDDLIIWFRPEARSTVVWAGDPNEKIMEQGRLLPRKSFERWIELKSAHSRPWGKWKLDLASRLSHAIMAVLSAQFVKLKILNEKLELASSVKDRFLAQMSHELRTPLNAVLGFSELVVSGFAGPTTPKQQEYLGDVLSAGNHLLSLINDILDVSRLEAGKYEVTPVPLDAVNLTLRVTEMLGPQAGKQGVSLQSPAAQTIPIVTDERSVVQILVNLVSNAIKFTPSGGSVRVKVAEELKTIAFTISDTGVGMSTETLRDIGTPFYQAASTYMAPAGTGLGLYIVLALVKANGGTLSVDSKPNLGTTVVVRLPKGPTELARQI